MIEPTFLDELDRFHASVARETHSRQRGQRDSPAVGEGLTFSDYRRYVPGDEPGLVDWKLYGRTDELYVKRFEEERQATVHVLMDVSDSMDFGEGETNKYEYGAKLGLGSAYLAARENETFHVTTFGGEELERLDGARSDRGELLRLIERCNEYDVGGDRPIGESLASYARTIESTALVVVVSDFLADTDRIDRGLAALADSEVVLAHVVAPEEREPPASGDTVFRSPETGTELRTYYGQRLDEEYRDRLDEHLTEVATIAESLQARHTVVDTDAPFIESFSDVWMD